MRYSPGFSAAYPNLSSKSLDTCQVAHSLRAHCISLSSKGLSRSGALPWRERPRTFAPQKSMSWKRFCFKTVCTNLNKSQQVALFILRCGTWKKNMGSEANTKLKGFSKRQKAVIATIYWTLSFRQIALKLLKETLGEVCQEAEIQICSRTLYCPPQVPHSCYRRQKFFALFVEGGPS